MYLKVTFFTGPRLHSRITQCGAPSKVGHGALLLKLNSERPRNGIHCIATPSTEARGTIDTAVQLIDRERHAWMIGTKRVLEIASKLPVEPRCDVLAGRLRMIDRKWVGDKNAETSVMAIDALKAQFGMIGTAHSDTNTQTRTQVTGRVNDATA
eukprot:COSAG02_NODE_7169_length_3139_cov_1.525329_5_plen_154_part_00